MSNFSYNKSAGGAAAGSDKKSTFGAAKSIPADPNTAWARMFKDYQKLTSLDIDTRGFHILSQGSQGDYFKEGYNKCTVQAIRIFDYLCNGCFKTVPKYVEEDPKKTGYGAGYGSKTGGFGFKKDAKQTQNLTLNVKPNIDFKNIQYSSPDVIHPETPKKLYIPSSFSQKQDQVDGFGAQNISQGNVDEEELENYPTLFEKKIPPVEVLVDKEKALRTMPQALNVSGYKLTAEQLKKNRGDTKDLSVQESSCMTFDTCFHIRVMRKGIGALEIFTKKINDGNDLDTFVRNIILNECFIDIEAVKPPFNIVLLATMFSVWPKDKRGIRTNLDINEEDYQATLMKFCETNDFEFISYSKEGGIFQFLVRSAENVKQISIP